MTQSNTVAMPGKPNVAISIVDDMHVCAHRIPDGMTFAEAHQRVIDYYRSLFPMGHIVIRHLTVEPLPTIPDEPDARQ